MNYTEGFGKDGPSTHCCGKEVDNSVRRVPAYVSVPQFGLRIAAESKTMNSFYCKFVDSRSKL